MGIVDSVPAELAVGAALAIAIYKVAAQLLRLIPPDEANQGAYRYLRYGIIAAAALLTLAVLCAVVGLYLARALSGALPAPF